ncbi:hypothetical protein MLD38_016948 [Melastoma candidum]|uniref:Uncharacterized protein n=1 Tax=Melastoma candidum TaxID=119954 RepID=A0ACB9QND4_9MYRT|nr:hypothetical protein MLD38_016948 [Melastoma candidum]
MEVCFEETELCLGLPGASTKGGGAAGAAGGTTPPVEAEFVIQKSTGKRAFMDLELNLKSEDSSLADGGLNETVKKSNLTSSSLKDGNTVVSSAAAKDLAKPPAKAQVAGWPPVRSYRKNMMAPQKAPDAEDAEKKGSGSAAFVKVSMDGAPYLRKVDLKMYGSYKELSDSLGKMFSSFTMGSYGAQGMKDFMNGSKLMNLLNSSDYVPSYEDKDGDWMLIGDVPWEMFVESCKRLRIMKGSEAIGLAPRAMEKCKSRS